MIFITVIAYRGFPGGSVVKNLSANAGEADLIPGQEDLLDEGMATHSCILAWRIPWTEEPGGLQSMGSQRNGHHSVTKQLYTQLKIK